jgi:hypothetical protein
MAFLTLVLGRAILAFRSLLFERALKSIRKERSALAIPEDRPRDEALRTARELGARFGRRLAAKRLGSDTAVSSLGR